MRWKALVPLLLAAVVGVGAGVDAWATPFTVDITAGGRATPSVRP